MTLIPVRKVNSITMQEWMKFHLSIAPVRLLVPRNTDQSEFVFCENTAMLIETKKNTIT